jgi:DNA-binding GntR family transcriptional regulator
MAHATKTKERRPSVDVIFNHLYDEILSLRLRPGDKISEAEIGARFGVSRQPVRDAFSRLENLDLLLIQPQKATEVKRFSLKAIEKSRFVRAAVEAEVLRRAAAECDEEGAARLDECLDRQREIVRNQEHHKFDELDYEFHQILCEIAKVDYAFEVISAEKAKIDRICILGLSKEKRMPQLLQDHEDIAEGVKQGNSEAAVEAGMKHLARLDRTIDTIAAQHEDYLDP